MRSIISRDSNENNSNSDNHLGMCSHLPACEETVMGKGDKRRPDQTTKEERALRDRYATTKMTFDQFEKAYQKLMKQGLIKRNGRVIE